MSGFRLPEPSQLPKLSGVLPRTQGLHAAVSPSNQELRSLPPITAVKLSYSLIDLQNDFVFFTHGLLFVEGHFVKDPIEEWMLVNDKAGKVGVVEFHYPVYRGMTRPGIGKFYDKCLMVCDLETWDAMSQLLNAIVGFSMLERKYLTGFVHDVVMPDPKTWDGGYPEKRLTTKAVGVSSTDGLWYIDSYKGFLPPPHGTLGQQTQKLHSPRRAVSEYLPVATRLDPEPQVLETASLLFR